MEKGFFSSIIDPLFDAVFIIDRNHKVLAWNRAMEKMTGISCNQALGQGNDFYSLPFYENPAPMLLDLILNPALEKSYSRHFWRDSKGFYVEGFFPNKLTGEQFFYEIKAIPLCDEQGELYAAMEIIRDSTFVINLQNNSQLAREQAEAAFQQLMAVEEELRQQFEELQATEQELRKQFNYTNTMIDNLNELFYTFDKDIRLTFINKKSMELLGYRPEELIGTSPDTLIFPSEDLEWIKEEARRRISDGFPASYVLPVRHRDGSKKYFKINSAPIKEDGHIVGGMVLADDITEDIKGQEALRDSERNLRRITDNMLDLISELDTNGRLIYSSPSHLSVLGYTHEKMKNIKLRDFVHPDDLPNTLKALKLGIQTGKAGRIEQRCKHANGYYVWTETVGNPVLHDGIVTGVILASRDITKRKELEQGLRYLGVHDSLTNLYNRTYFEEQMMHLNDDKYNPVGLVILDLDGLKLVNDTLGHEAGDRLLIKTADILRTCFPDGNVIARVGGDEFAVLLANTKREIIDRLITQLQTEIAKYNQANPQLPLSISVGMAVREVPGISLRETFKEADDYMYRVKLNRSRSTRSSVVQTLLKALEARDFITEGHGERMQSLAVRMGRRLGVPDSTLTTLRLLAQFHDIGKVGVPDRILFKDTVLTPEEYDEMKRHCEIGQRIALASSELASVADLILKHHEWWNGKGYPLGLCGEQIPLECRILALVDAYDAMTNDRPYRKALSSEAARKEIIRCRGTQFDPSLTDLFLGLIS